ncbi:MAG TPA: PAAR domain-containing protein [Blastocatellia bacterium]|nr:PAAR domain-containing protein [Blastocatellia bacterium]
MSWFENLSLAVDQKASGVTGDRTSGWDRAGNTWSAMFGSGGEAGQPGVLGNMVKSFSDAGNAWSDIGKATGDPPVPPTDAEKSARIVRATQQSVGAAINAIGMGQDMLNVGFANLTAPLAALWPSMPAATLTCLYVGFPHAHLHPPSLVPPAPPVPLPSLGPVLLGTCVQVLINYLPAARAGDIGWAPTCGGFAAWFEIKTGSSNVFIGGSRAARMGDICMACAPATSPRAKFAGQAMARVGALAGKAEVALEVAGLAAGALGVAADAAEAAVEDDQAMQNALILSAAMGAAQMAADIAAMVIARAMGTDPGVPPSIGALVIGHPNVLIGGFPMVNIPNPIDLLLKRLKRYKAKPTKPERHGAGCKACQTGGGI